MTDKPILRAVQLSADDRLDLVAGLQALNESIIDARATMILRNSAEAVGVALFTSALERIDVLRRRLS